MIGRLADQARPARCSTIRVITPAFIHRPTSPDTAISSYGGYNRFYGPDRSPGPIIEAACWSHGRRKFLELADIARNAKRKVRGKTSAFVASMTLATVQRIDALFGIERRINGQLPAERLVARSAAEEFSPS